MHDTDTPGGEVTGHSTGRCLCGAVRYHVSGPLRPVIYCHCDMCRRTTGHFGAFTACDRDSLHLEKADALKWYQSSPRARRGFCGVCGSILFWDAPATPSISIAAGSLSKPTGLRASEHIFTESAGDYYQILDELAQHSRWPPGWGSLGAIEPIPGQAEEC